MPGKYSLVQGHLVQCYSHTHSFSYNENWYIFHLEQEGIHIKMNFVCHIHLFDPCILHAAKEVETYFDFDI